MSFASFFTIIRYKNLLLLAFMLLVLRYGFLNLQNIPLALSNFNYSLFILSIILIAAAGYVINDIFDQDTDAINKPEKLIVGQAMSETKAYNLYAILNISGVFLGFYLSNVIHKPSFASIFIAIAATLYVYATGLKQTILIGNIIVAFLTSFTIVLVGIFDLYPLTTPYNQATQAVYFQILLDYAIFAFAINLIRELVKDMQDSHGDDSAGIRTFAVVAGLKTTKIVVVFLSILTTSGILYYCYSNYFLNNLFYATSYIVLFVLSPLILFTINVYAAVVAKDFGRLSILLKTVMFFGILSAFFVTLNILYNA